MQRFTTWCHQNYEFNPNIMVAKNSNTNYALGNLIRRPDGICKDFGICNLSDKDLPVINKVSTNFENKILYTKINNTNILKQEDMTFTILVIIISLLFLALWIYLAYKTRKNLLNLD